MLGYLHSIESMGLVDGPGIRTVVFLQGCRLRCRYCHNPDTWPEKQGSTITPQELVQKLCRFRPYFSSSGGGVTFSGGEPLMQPEFLEEALSLCKQEGLHTCIDTAGVGLGEYDTILAKTDLLLYDVKHYTPEGYRNITGQTMEETERFLQAAERAGVPMWVRHVVVPGLTDSPEHMQGLRDYIRTIPNVQKVELLPYHRLGEHKYEELGIAYPLKGVPAMSETLVRSYQTDLF